MNPYDETPYPSYVHPQTHPDRLAVAGTLLGLSPAPPERCRVLEIGCGDGTNLFAMALAAPGSEFVGIDLAPLPVGEGREAARELGLGNVDLRVGDVAALDPGLGDFDYVVAHGVYSWVPAPVRDALLAAARRHLRPHGIAFVSYSAYPGAHVRQMFRDMALFHVRAIRDPDARTREAASFFRFLLGGTVARGPWGDLLRHELEGHVAAPPGLVRHDHLAEVNEPSWFHEFASHAASHDLRFLAEADWVEESDRMLPEEARRALAPLSADPVLRSQYLDFLKGRRFRQSLLVPSAARPASRPDPSVVTRFRVASPAQPSGEPVGADGVERFVGPLGGRVTTDSPRGREALRILGAIWPRSLPFADLRDRAARAAADRGNDRGEDDATLARFLSDLHDAGVVRFHLLHLASTTEVGARPVANPIARRQARRGAPAVCTLEGPSIALADEIGRALVGLLDGTRDRTALARDLAPALPPGSPGVEPEQLETALQRLAEAGLLLA